MIALAIAAGAVWLLIVVPAIAVLVGRAIKVGAGPTPSPVPPREETTP